MYRHPLGTSTLESVRHVNVDLLHLALSRYESGALALLSVRIPGAMESGHLSLYRNGETGDPFVGGTLPREREGSHRPPIALRGRIQHICTALSRGIVKDSVVERYGGLLEAPAHHLWLDDAEQDVRFSEMLRARPAVFDLLERVDRLRAHPGKPGTWVFRVSIAGSTVGDGVVIDGCECADLDTDWPTVLAPRIPGSDEPYARFFPECAKRIAAAVRLESRTSPGTVGRSGNGLATGRPLHHAGPRISRPRRDTQTQPRDAARNIDQVSGRREPRS